MKQLAKEQRLENRRAEFDKAKSSPHSDERYHNGGFHRPGSLKK